MKTAIIPTTILFVLTAATAMAQPVIKVEVSADTIAAGDIVSVTYTIEGGDGRFELPDLSGLPVISGPNTSSSYMYQNGRMSSSQAYSFRMRAIEEGMLFVPEAAYLTKDSTMTIQPVKIVVLAYRDAPARPGIIRESPVSTRNREKRKF